MAKSKISVGVSDESRRGNDDAGSIGTAVADPAPATPSVTFVSSLKPVALDKLNAASRASDMDKKRRSEKAVKEATEAVTKAIKAAYTGA